MHTVAHDDNESEEVRDLANKTWQALRRTTKAGQRRSVSGGCLLLAAALVRMPRVLLACAGLSTCAC